jgi:outer membrane immunogenic protein
MSVHLIRLIAAALLAVVAATPATAQNMPADWRGLYLGAHAGGSGISRDVSRASFGTTGVSTTSESGGMYGAFGGFNFQSGAWVYGAEVDGSWGCKDRACLYSARGRFGYASGNALLYGTAGVAWREVGVNWVNGFTGAQVKQVDTAIGFIGGVGAEYQLWSNWALRGELLYAHLGDQSFTSPSGLTKLGIQDDVFIARVGLSYTFK